MMRRTLLAVTLALALAGCADKSILTGGTSITATVQNPIGLNEQFEIESAYAVATRSALAYHRLRQCRKSETESLTNVCSRRAVKLQIQAADRKVREVLIPFRRFVSQNQTISALSLVDAVREAIDAYQNVLKANGVN